MKDIICIFFSIILLIGCNNSNSTDNNQAQNEKAKIEELRIEKEKLEKEQIEKEKAEAERIQQEKLEQEKLEQERIEKEKAEKAKRQKSSAQLSCNHCGNTFKKNQGWYAQGSRIYQYGDYNYRARSLVGNSLNIATGGATKGDGNGNPKFCSQRCAQLH